VSTSIFFSHSNRDRKWCEWLAADADAIGVTAYLAEHDQNAGKQLAEKVKRNIDKCKALVVLLTDNSVSSSYVQQEIGYAIAKRKLVIPLVQPGIAKGDLAMLEGLEYIEFDFQNPRPAKDGLATELQRLAERQRKQGELETLIAVGLCIGVLVLLVNEGGLPAAGP
jgi:nucleoside 2-deoxyribosyltransferase